MAPTSQIDLLLTTQIAIAWAGEAGEDRRLGWWRSDLVSEFGGEDLFKRLLPHSWEWAVLQSVRETARRRDAVLRRQDHDADRILSLYGMGFEIDERADERFQDLKRSAIPPLEALPGLRDVISKSWQQDRFSDWVVGHGKVDYVTAPIGRRIRGNAPYSLDQVVHNLVAAFRPLPDAYPLPHYRRAS